MVFPSWSRFLWIFLTLALHSTNAEENDDKPISIYTSNSQFASQRKCAGGCFTGYYGGIYDHIGNVLSCSGFPPRNGCYCRTDLTPLALTYLSTCIKAACANTVDIASALSFYDEYCEANKPTRAQPTLPSDAPAETTPISGVPSETQTPDPGTEVVILTVVSTQVETQTPDPGTEVVILTIVSTQVPTSASSSSASATSLPVSSSTTAPTPSIPLATSGDTTSSTPSLIRTTSILVIPTFGDEPTDIKRAGSGLSTTDKIALGTGISLPLAGIIVTILICRYQRRWYKSSKPRATANGRSVDSSR